MMRSVLEQIRSLDCFSEVKRPVYEKTLEALSSAIGLTLLGSTTLLDRLNVPTYYAIRPRALHPGCIYSSGKSFTEPAARLGALFECYERWAGEKALLRVDITLEAIDRFVREEGRRVLVVSDDAECSTTWAVGKHLVTGDPVFAALSEIKSTSRSRRREG